MCVSYGGKTRKTHHTNEAVPNPLSRPHDACLGKASTRCLGVLFANLFLFITIKAHVCMYACTLTVSSPVASPLSP